MWTLFLLLSSSQDHDSRQTLNFKVNLNGRLEMCQLQPRVDSLGEGQRIAGINAAGIQAVAKPTSVCVRTIESITFCVYSNQIIWHRLI